MPARLPKTSQNGEEHEENGDVRIQRGWDVKPSALATDTINPIRCIIENMQLKPNPRKDMISLSIGDPTVFGNLKPCEEIVEAVVKSIRSFQFNGYGPSVGFPEAREAVARFSSTPGANIEAKDVFLTSGCSQALDLCISVLANPGQNILVPRPGFPLYRTLAEGLGIKTKYYNLLPDRNWEVDLADLQSQIDSNTAAIVVNSPSNPCGSVYSRTHLQEILNVAAQNYVPIIADEIYDYFVFPGEEFHPIASLTTNVPVLTCGGLTKRFLVPGWRIGWVLFHDRGDVFGPEIRQGLQSLCQRLMGCNTLIQGALPAILRDTPNRFFVDTINVVKTNADLAYSALCRVPGLRPIMPSGAMYMMVGIDMPRFPDFRHDLDFVERMVSEQSVMCLPGMCFNYPNYVRLVLTSPEDNIRAACARITEFCHAHYSTETPSVDSNNNSETEVVLDNRLPVVV